MGIYIYNIVVVILLGILFLHMYKSNLTKKMYFLILTLQMALIVGLRGYDVGWDTRNYVWYFSRAANFDLKYIITKDIDIEKGYVLLEYLVSKLSTNPTVFFLIIALFYFISVGRFIYKDSKDPILSYVLFIALGFFTFSMTALRQTVAIGVVLYSYKFIKERKFKLFVVNILFAAIFHKSAIFFLPAYFLAYKKITIKYILLMIITIPLSYIFRDSIFNLLIYISGAQYSTYQTVGPITLILLMILILIGGIVQRRSIILKDKENIIYYNMLFIAIIFGMLAFANPAWLRIVYYYHIATILFVPVIINSFKDRHLQIILKVLTIVILLGLCINNLTQNSPFVPYDFFWNQ